MHIAWEYRCCPKEQEMILDNIKSALYSVDPLANFRIYKTAFPVDHIRDYFG